MTAPAGFIEVIADYDALPMLIATGAIAVISRLPPTASDAKSAILLMTGERLAVGTEYDKIVARIAQDVGTDEMREGN